MIVTSEDGHVVCRQRSPLQLPLQPFDCSSWSRNGQCPDRCCDCCRHQLTRITVTFQATLLTIVCCILWCVFSYFDKSVFVGGTSDKSHQHFANFTNFHLTHVRKMFSDSNLVDFFRASLKSCTHSSSLADLGFCSSFCDEDALNFAAAAAER